MKIEFELFIKYFSGGASPEEAEQVETFAQSSPEGFVYVQSLFKSWLESGDEHFEHPNVQKEWNYFNLKYLQRPRIRRFKMVSLAASVAIILGLGGYFAFFTNKTSSEIISVMAQQEEMILLKDSSKITLSSGSSLEYPKTFNKTSRELALHGDAHFDVVHDSNWPFIIHLQNNLNIKVTGTVFSVKEEGVQMTVTLQKGSILFYNQKDTLPLIAGQSGQFLVNENKFLLLPPKLKIGSFKFNDLPLDAIATQLEAYFQIQVHFKNPKIAHCHFSAGMDNKNLEQIIQIIAVTFNLDYHIENNNVTFDGAGCD